MTSYNLNLYEQAPCTLPPVNSPNQKTVILDLDHTLICSLFCPLILPYGSYDFLVKWDNERAWYVKKRPYVDDFLRYLSQNNFEIVIFTAGSEGYASPILDKLDPKGLISHRLYAQSCKIHYGWPVKDLSDLGRDLKNVVIIDDQPTSYRLQPENGIPIKKFIGDRQDHELKKLMDEFFDKCEQYKDLKDALKHYMGVQNSNQEREIVLKTNRNNSIFDIKLRPTCKKFKSKKKKVRTMKLFELVQIKNYRRSRSRKLKMLLQN